MRPLAEKLRTIIVGGAFYGAADAAVFL